jgi:hypothetical protein
MGAGNGASAVNQRTEADRLLKPPEALAGSVETELVPAVRPNETPPPVRFHMVSTLADPNSISVDASEQRAYAAMGANVLSPAFDTAVTAGATSSIEKMICHQLAAVHYAGMEMLKRVQEANLTSTPQVDLVRLTNAAVRLFEVFQTGSLALQKLKTGGKQHVVVQHQQLVNVSSGGQAVVAGKVKQGGIAKRGQR